MELPREVELRPHKPRFSGEVARHGVRSAVSFCLYRSGLLALGGKWIPPRSSGPKFLILNYHRIGTAGPPLWSGVPPSLFETQMRYLRKHYRILSLKQMCQELATPRESHPAVAITFDDGYRDTYACAFPILRKYEIPATVYLIVDSIETGNLPWYDRVFLAAQLTDSSTLEVEGLGRFTVPDHSEKRFALGGQIAAQLAHLSNDERQRCCQQLNRLVPQAQYANCMLSWNEVQAMAKEGITFGSHTLTHPNVAKLSPGELDEELGTSKEIMERRMEASVHDFSFPFGRLSEDGNEEAKVLRRLGYRSGVTSAAGLNLPGTDCFTLRRSQMVEGPGGLCGVSLFAYRVGKAFLRG